ncbi:MAG: DUF1572 family protein [Bryobacterales bacterium]|nr:DUF1572 family protein [Bryobacterales bacterium]
MHGPEELFLDFSVRKLEQMMSRIEEACSGLTPEQFWLRTGDHGNAIGNLVLHLAGNVRQWILHGIAGQADTRRRDAEFAARTGDPATALADLRQTVDEAISVVRHLPPSRLPEHVLVQVFDVSVLDDVYHVVEHFSYHAGQIFLLVKQLTQRDLGFYQYLRKDGPPDTVITP